jgi:hypothetical protein
MSTGKLFYRLPPLTSDGFEIYLISKGLNIEFSEIFNERINEIC